MRVPPHHRFVLALALAGGLNLSAASIFNVATTYNVFVFGNFTGSSADIQGGLAAGGTVSLWSYHVGGDFKQPGADSLIAATDLLLTNGTITGDVYDGTAGGLSSYNITGSVTSGGGTAGSPIDFTEAAVELKALSASLAKAAATAGDSCTLVYSTVVCTATHAGINIIDVSDAVLTGGSSIKFVSAYPDATIIVNVSGSKATIGRGGWEFEGTTSSKVLLNFVDATKLSLTGSLSSNILAPNADVTGTGGAFTGNLIANSYSGTTEFHDTLFTGEVPTSTPEPTTLLLGGAGLLAIACLRRRSGC